MTDPAKEWLLRAKEDLDTVEKLLNEEGLTNIAAFHAQQCIEKCLKALIESSGKPVPRIHDLIRLSALVDKTWQDLIDENTLIELSTVYLNSRYPITTGFLPSGKPDLQDIRRFFQGAADIFRFVDEAGI